MTAALVDGHGCNFELTRRDALPQVLRGLEAMAAFPEAHPIKVNAVGIRGFTEREVLPFARFAREHPFEVRFIGFMPLDADRAWEPGQVLAGEEIRAAIEAVHPLEPCEREPSATARVYRVTSDGRLRTIIRAAVHRKELKHRVDEPGFVQPERTMSAIGG